LAAAVGLDGNVTKLPPKRALLEATTRFSLAVAAYARALALKIDETDVDAITRFRDALAPIDPLRVSGRAGSVEEEDDDEGDVEEPTPDPNGPFVPASDDPIDNPFITP
jgi:hypothetical protein